MKLSEGKLFTIEALNRIEGFVWPERANYAFMNHSEMFATFTSIAPHIIAGEEHGFYDGFYDGNDAKHIGTGRSHSDWRNSLITRAEFESVDGWVRNTDRRGPEVTDGILFDVRAGKCSKTRVDGSDVEWDAYPHEDNYIAEFWRYHKQTKEAEMQPEEKRPSIEEIYGKYQTTTSSLIDAQMQVDYFKKQSEEALADIKKWNKERGFSVSVIECYATGKVRA